ncbi:serine hydrolase domain-containing protein [Luteibacter sp.]|uniref:serine hydrolase domain-containing protein n=1 Tax=Luteibacter sp. TaxID=1886636 RepID=UPI003F804E81
MERTRYARLGCLGACLCAALFTSAVAAEGRASADIALYVRQCAAALACNGSYLVARSGDVVYDGTVGKASADRRSRLLPGSAFDIGAIGEQFTVAAVLRLAERHQLALDDAVSKYPPGFPDPTVTIRQLLTRTSGIPDGASERQLRGLVASIAGQSYADFVREQFFEPLDMRHSWIRTATSGADDDAQRAHGMRMTRNGSLKPMDDTTGCDSKGLHGTYSTTGDLLLWARALQAGKVVPKEAWRDVMGDARVSQDGRWEGFASNLTVLPDQDTVIVILTNNDRPEEVRDARNAFVGILRKEANLIVASG